MRAIRTLLFLVAGASCSANDRLPTDLGDATLRVRVEQGDPRIRVTNMSQDAITISVLSGGVIASSLIIPCSGERLEPGITRVFDVVERYSPYRVSYCPLPTPGNAEDEERRIWVEVGQ